MYRSYVTCDPCELPYIPCQKEVEKCVDEWEEVKRPTLFCRFKAICAEICKLVVSGPIQADTLALTDQSYLAISNPSTNPSIPVVTGSPYVLAGLSVSKKSGKDAKYDQSTGYASLCIGRYSVTANAEWKTGSTSESSPYVSMMFLVNDAIQETSTSVWSTTVLTTNQIATELYITDTTPVKLGLGFDNHTGQAQSINRIYWKINKTG